MRAFVRDHVRLEEEHWALVAEVMFRNPGWALARRPLRYLHVASRREIGRRRGQEDFFGPREGDGPRVQLMEASKLELIRPAAASNRIGFLELLEDTRHHAKLTDEETAVLAARGFGTTGEVPELLGIGDRDSARIRKSIDRKLRRAGYRGRKA